MKKIVLICFLLSCTMPIVAQTTFQKIFSQEGDVECFGAYQLASGGYVFTGLATVNGTTKIFMAKTDCHANILWSKTYANSFSWNNISQRVIETHDHGFLLAASIGSFNAYNILLVRTNANGVALWKKTMSGSGDDAVNSVIETATQEYIIAGSTNTYGQDANTFYKDIYLMKIDDDGNFMWGKTFGSDNGIDEAFDVVEAFNGDYAVTGRYLSQETLQCFLMRTDAEGNLIFLKTYGDTLQHTTGYGIANTLDGGFVITGSSTLTKESYLDYPDEFLMKTDANGDTLWCRSYHGSNIDGSENGSSVVVKPDGTYAIGVATFSYPSVGFVPNKQCVLKTDTDGHMEFMRAYNLGGSHYPYLTSSKGNDGYVISGFSNFYTPQHFSATLISLDNDFSSGCLEIDETNLTYEEHMPVTIHQPPVYTGSGGSLITNSSESDFTLYDSTLCFYSLDSCFVFTASNELDINASGISCFPNPAVDQLNVVFSASMSAPGKMILTDISGRHVLSLEINIHSGVNFYQIPVSAYSEGVYLLKVMEGSTVAAKKLLFTH